MPKTIALNNQSLVDITMQLTGSANNLLIIAMYNGLVPSEPLTPGQIILIPEGVNVNTDVARYYKVNSILPATSISEEIQQTFEKSCEEKLYDCFK